MNINNVIKDLINHGFNVIFSKVVLRILADFYAYNKNIFPIFLFENTLFKLNSVSKSIDILFWLIFIHKDRLNNLKKGGYYAVQIINLILLKPENSQFYTKKYNLFSVIVALAYAGEIDALHRLKNSMILRFSDPGLSEYTEAIIIKSQCKDSSQDWIRRFIECGNNSRFYHVLPEHIRHARSFFLDENLEKLFYHWKLEFDKRILLPKNNPIILISCTFDYFKIYSNYYIKNFIKFNDNKIIFLLVSSTKLTDEEIFFYKNLCLIYKNVFIREVTSPSGFNCATYSSLARFLMLPEIILEFDSSVIISDIDFKVDCNLFSIFDKSKDFSAAISEHSLVPWDILNANLCFFKKSHGGILFSRLLQTFFEFAILNGASWTVDQAGLYLVYRYCRKNNLPILFGNIERDVGIRFAANVPGRFGKRKVQVKAKIISN